MKLFIAICITLLLMSVSAFAQGGISGNGKEWVSGTETGEFGAFIVCIPSLFLKDGKTVEHLGNFFVDPTGDRAYTIIGDEFLTWKLEGPALDGYGNRIKYHVQTTPPENFYDPEFKVSLDAKWTIVSHNINMPNLGGLNFPNVELIDQGSPGGCDGYATFKIIALTLTVQSGASPGLKRFYVSVKAEASI